MAIIQESKEYITPDAAAGQAEVVIYTKGPTPTITKAPQELLTKGRELRETLVAFLDENGLEVWAEDDAYLYLAKASKTKVEPEVEKAPEKVEPEVDEPETDPTVNESEVEGPVDLLDEAPKEETSSSKKSKRK